jgi:release factor glutamine methyltransferase
MLSLNISQALVEVSQVLRKSGVPDPRREAASLLAMVTGRDRTFLIAHAEAELSPDEIDRLKDFVQRRASGEPMQYITGHQEFFKLDFEVEPGVLIPRPETEILVEKALQLIDPSSSVEICDVGTGSGCIVISILHERANVRGVGLDISPAALKIAGRNAARLGVAGKLELKESDCFSALQQGKRFGMLVSNPPYVAESAMESLQREVRDHEPIEALTSGPDGLNMIRRLLRQAPSYLEPGGHFLFEMGFDQSEAVRELVARSSWELVEILDDLQGIPRIANLRKLAAD